MRLPNSLYFLLIFFILRRKKKKNNSHIMFILSLLSIGAWALFWLLCSLLLQHLRKIM